MEPTGRAINLTLKSKALYLGVGCKTCGSPIPIAILGDGVRPPTPLLGTSFLIACADEACQAQHSYAQAEIVKFRWPGKK